jgi:hypothetical protein
MCHCHCESLKWHLRASRSSTLRLDLEQSQTSQPCPKKRKPKHTESSRSPQIARTTYHPLNAHELGQPGPYGAARIDTLS